MTKYVRAVVLGLLLLAVLCLCGTGVLWFFSVVTGKGGENLWLDGVRVGIAAMAILAVWQGWKKRK